MRAMCPSIVKVTAKQSIHFDIEIETGPSRGERREQFGTRNMQGDYLPGLKNAVPSKEFLQCDRPWNHEGKHRSSFVHFIPLSVNETFPIEWDAPV